MAPDTAGSTERGSAPATAAPQSSRPASVPVSDGSESGSNVDLAATCDDHHIFPRDAFARLARAEVWCDKPAEHKGPHSAVKGSMLLVWRDKP